MIRAAFLELLAERILALEKPHPLRVAIDGVATAGKTTLAEELVAPIQRRGRPVIRASGDGFHRPRVERYRRGRDSAPGYYYDAFDYEALCRALLKPLGPGGDRRYRPATFDYCADAPLDEPPRRAPDDTVLLCDGMFLLRPELAGGWDYAVLLLVDDEVVLRRAARRDRALLGVEVRARYRTRYLPAQRLYEEQARPRRRADLLVDNNDPAHPRLIVAG